MTTENSENLNPSILVIQAEAEGLEKKKAYQSQPVNTKREGKSFLRKTMVHGRPYWQTVRYLYNYDGMGGRRLKIVKHHGTRKPRRI